MRWAQLDTVDAVDVAGTMGSTVAVDAVDAAGMFSPVGPAVWVMLGCAVGVLTALMPVGTFYVRTPSVSRGLAAIIASFGLASAALAVTHAVCPEATLVMGTSTVLVFLTVVILASVRYLH